MAIITGFDSTDSSLNIPKFYLGKITGQENIGTRDSDGNPIPYYSSGDIGTLQSSVLLQQINEDEFKGPETAANEEWINFLTPANSSETSKSKEYSINGVASSTVTWNWVAGSSNNVIEIAFASAILEKWNDQIPFGQDSFAWHLFFGEFVKVDLRNANPSFAVTLKTHDDTFEALQEIKNGEISHVEKAISNDNRFFNDSLIRSNGIVNLKSITNSIIANSYDSAQSLIFDRGFNNFDAMYNEIEMMRVYSDFLIVDNSLRNTGPVDLFKSLVPYENIMSGVIGNYQAISGLSITGISGYPTGYEDGKYLRSTTSGLEYVDITDPVLAFTGLTDTPATITPNQYLRGSADGQNLIYSGVSFLNDIIDRPTTPQSGYLQLDSNGVLSWAAGTTNGNISYNFTGSEFFTGLKDTPSNYDQFKFLRSSSNGIEYVDINNSIISFTGLKDSPNSFTADKYLKINGAGDGIIYSDVPAPVVAFTGLTDTPSAFTNSSGKLLQVNNASNAIQFVDISGLINSQQIDWKTYPRYGDLPSASENKGMFALVETANLSGAYVSNGSDWIKLDSDSEEGSSSFTGLLDTPNIYNSGKFLRSTETGIEYFDIENPTTAFTGLTDTPNDYAGQSGRYLMVSDNENSIEFKDPTFYTGAFVGFGGAICFQGRQNNVTGEGWHERTINNIIGASGIKGAYLDNNEIVLPKGKYLINAEAGFFSAEASSNPAPTTKVKINFTQGDYVNDNSFESFSNRGNTNQYGQIRGSVRGVIESQNVTKFKVLTFVPTLNSLDSDGFSSADTDVTILDLGASKDFLSFTGLLDSPSSYDGASGQYLKINDNEDGLEYVDLFNQLSGVISSQEINWNVYASVSDLPNASEHHGMFAHVHGEGAAYMAHAGQWQKIYPQSAGGGGSSTFTGLSDTPSTYNNGKFLQSVSDGLEWVNAPEGTINYYDTISNLPSSPSAGELAVVGCKLYISCDGQWTGVGTDSIAPPAEAPACVSSLQEYNDYNEYKDDFLSKNVSPSFSAGLNNQNNIHDFIHDVCLFADSNLDNEKNIVYINETTYKWGMFVNDQNINISAIPYSGDDHICTFSGWRSHLNGFPSSNSGLTVFIDQDSAITGCFECLIVGAGTSVQCADVLFHLQTSCPNSLVHLQASSSDNNIIYDKSPNNNTIQNSNISISTSEVHRGDRSIHFDGSQTNRLKLTGDYPLYENSGCTIESWIYWDPAGGSPDDDCLVAHVNNSTLNDGDYLINFSSSASNGLMIGYGAGKLYTFNTSTLGVPTREWFHFAFVEAQAGDKKVYINGSGYNFPTSINPGDWQNAGDLYIGHWNNGNNRYAFRGYIQDFRITANEALYTGDFVPSAELLPTPCASGDYSENISAELTSIEKSSNNVEIELVGTPAINKDNVLFEQGTLQIEANESVKFDPPLEDLDADGDFTIEFWMKHISFLDGSSKHAIIYLNEGTAGTDSQTALSIGITSSHFFAAIGTSPAGASNSASYYSVTSKTSFLGSDYDYQDWNHIAIVRKKVNSSSSMLYLFINGDLQNEVDTLTNPLHTVNRSIELGNAVLTGFFRSYSLSIQDFRIVKKALYDSNFIPPTKLLNISCQ